MASSSSSTGGMTLVPEHVRNFLDRLVKVRKHSANQWSALCPSHEDKSASLSISIGDKNNVIANCKANHGCTFDSICAAIGIDPKDTFDPTTRKPRSEQINIYPYYDEEGTLIFEVVKKVKPDGRKEFVQRQPNGAGGWTYSTTGLRKPLYRLPQIIQAISDGKEIIVLEGEKDVEALVERGFAATCNPGGAGKWLQEHTQTLRNANVVVCVDNDTPGYKHGYSVADALEGVAASVRVIAPPEPHNDAFDALAAGVPFDKFPAINLAETLELHDPFRKLIGDLKTIQDATHLTYEQKVARLKSMVNRSEQLEVTNTFGTLETWQNILNKPQEHYDWIVPQMIERGDRYMLVAGEGSGKSFLLRQIALHIAAGLHPFYRTAIPPKKTFFLDLENPERVIRRTSGKIMAGIKEKLPYAKIEDNILLKPDGMNILDPKDQAELERIIEIAEPDLLIISPIYKFYNASGSKTDVNSTIIEVVKKLDYLRETYQCALMMEHHAPFGGESTRVMRPIDSTVWLRWPDFGLSMYADMTEPGVYELRRFRGDRDTREWPEKITRNGEFGWSIHPY